MGIKLNLKFTYIAAAAIAALMATLGGLLYQNLSQWGAAKARLDHTRSALTVSENLYTHVLAAESSVRAYALNSNAENLQAYNKAMLAMNAEARLLSRMEAGHAAARLAGLGGLIARRRTFLNDLVVTKRNGGSAARMAAATREGSRVSGEIDQLLQSFRQSERSEAAAIELERRLITDQRNRLLLTVFFSIFLVVLAALAAVLYSSREQRLAEEELATEHGHLQGVLDAATELSIISTDVSGTIRVFSAGAEKMLGYTAAEMVGRTPAAFHLREEVEERGRELTRLAGREVQGFEVFVDVCRTAPFERREWTYVRKDGRRLLVELVVTAVRDADGAINGFLGLATDITARKASQLQMRKLSTAVRHSPTSIVITNRDGLIEYANPKFYELTGYTEMEALGQNPKILASGSTPKSFYKELWDTLLAGKVWHGEFLNRKKNGELFWEHAAISPVKDPRGAITNFIAVKVDITEQKLAQSEMEKARNAALELARMKSEFLANMSHEIRTPMNAIIGMTGLLQDTQLTPRQRDYVATISTAGEALLDIINDILDFSKIEAGKILLEKSDFDVRETLESTLDLLAPRAQAKSLELALAIAEGVPEAARGDAGRLRQILMNLVGNAVKFTERGEILVSAELERRDAGGPTLRFSVKDTGIGVPPETQKNLFSPFTQADASTTRKYGGTGLGLSISKRLTELMGGTIGVSSGPGAGSTFWFSLPFAEAETVPARPDSSALAGVKALIVDDNAASREIVRHHLEAWKMDASAAASADEALEKLGAAVKEGAPFRLVVTDMQMPGKDGIMLAAAIKAAPALAGAGVVMMTSLGRDLDAAERAACGLSACVHKPLRRTALLAAVTTALTGRSAPAQRQASAAPGVRRPRNPFRVLLAEDNPVNQKVAFSQLERLGYECDLAANGMEVLEAVKRRPYDLILMDCQMPEMDGFQATAEVRRIEGDLRRTPIVAMTANALEGDREKCLAAGMDGYIPKPVRLEKLAEALAQWDTSLNAAVIGDLKALAGDDNPAFLAELANTYLADLPGRLEAIGAAAAAKDAEALRQAAHSLKGSSGNMGAQRLQKLCLLLETAARNGALDEAPGLVADIGREAEATRAALEILAKSAGGPSA